MSRKIVLLAALMFVLVGTLGAAFNVQRVEAGETIYIRANGDVEGTDKIQRDGNIYTFTDNIFNQSIVVERDWITLDGAGFSLTGTNVPYSIGINLFLRGLVEIKNLEIRGFGIGISLAYSGINVIHRNTIRNNTVGMELWGDCQDNIICLNNFIDNTIHVDATTLVFSNAWNWSYPWGGNYWDNYAGVDSHRGPDQLQPGSDGIYDTPYNITAGNIDNYPLRGGVWHLCGPWGTEVCCFWIVTNSPQVWGVRCGSIEFNVAGPDGTEGFCTVTIPHDVLEPPYTVTVSNNPVTHTTLFENETLSIIYFTYTHSTKEVVIVPEFPSFIIPPLFMIATLAAVILHRRKLPCDRKC